MEDDTVSLMRIFVHSCIKHLMKELQFKYEVAFGNVDQQNDRLVTAVRLSGGVLGAPLSSIAPMAGPAIRVASAGVALAAGKISASANKTEAQVLIDLFSKCNHLESVNGELKLSETFLTTFISVMTEIFQKFEYQYTNFISEGPLLRLDLIAKNVVHRVLNYFVSRNVTVNVQVRDVFTIALLEGEHADSDAALLTRNKDKIKCANIYKKSGYVINMNGSVFYIQHKHWKEKYGFRHIFPWENMQQICNNKYKFHNNFKYKYKLSAADIEIHSKEIISNIIDTEESLKFQSLSKKLTTLNENIERKLNVIESKLDMLGTDVSEIRTGVLEIKEKMANNATNTTNKNVWFNVPELILLSFAGRKGELEEINKKLQTNTKAIITQVAKVCGLGGVGKTSIAAKYAHENVSKFDGNAIFIRAESTESCTNSFKELAQFLNIPTTEKCGTLERSVKVIVKDVYEHFGDVKSLFIFDNVEVFSTIQPFLPSISPACNKPFILITTRERGFQFEDCDLETIELNEFSPDEARTFVTSYFAGRGVPVLNADLVDALTQTLHYFPCSLNQAVAYINKQRVLDTKFENVTKSIEEYLVDYKTRQDLSASENHYLNSLYKVWQTTIEKIKSMENGAEAVNILYVIAYLSPDSIEVFELFAKIVPDKHKLRECVEILDMYSLISVERGIASVHRLVQQVMQTYLSLHGLAEGTLNTLLATLDGSSNKQHIIYAWRSAVQFKSLIDKFFSISRYTFLKYTPLHVLAHMGEATTMKSALIHVKNNIETLDELGQTAFHVAAIHGNLECVKLLVVFGADINLKIQGGLRLGSTALHVVAHAGNKSLVKYLMDCNAQLIKDNFWKTPAICALRKGYFEIARMLGVTAEDMFEIFCSLGNVQGVQEELAQVRDKKEFLNGKGQRSALHLACCAGHLEVVKVLVENGADVNALTDDAILMPNANQLNYTEYMRILYNEKRIYVPLPHALRDNSFRMLCNEEYTPLKLAALHGHEHVVQFLSSHYAHSII